MDKVAAGVCGEFVYCQVVCMFYILFFGRQMLALMLCTTAIRQVEEKEEAVKCCDRCLTGVTRETNRIQPPIYNTVILLLPFYLIENYSHGQEVH